MARTTVEHHIEQAERLLEGTDRYYNGGQTHRHEPPSPEDVQRAIAHASVARALIAQRSVEQLDEALQSG